MTAESTTGAGESAQVALASFLKAQRAAEEVVARCEALAGTSDDLRTSARQMAEILKGSAVTLVQIQATGSDLTSTVSSAVDELQTAGSELKSSVQGTLEQLQTIQRAVESIEIGAADLEARLVRSAAASLDETLAVATGRLEETTRSAIAIGFTDLTSSMNSQIDHLEKARTELAESLVVAVSTVRGELAMDVSRQWRWADTGHVLSIVAFIVSGLGWLVFRLRGEDRYVFLLEEQRNAAAKVALLVFVWSILAFGVVFIALLRAAPRPWHSFVAGLFAVASALIAAHLGLAIVEGRAG